ncbi:MAG: hypothetical protein HC836_38155 [Richelia sp. RM2_1_2]|nr:hypothetical protein [Richelia sp. RM2_1_2]
MPEVLFTMRDVESAFFAEGDDKKFGLGKMALAAGGLAATAGLTALAIKNRKGIGQAAGEGWSTGWRILAQNQIWWSIFCQGYASWSIFFYVK